MSAIKVCHIASGDRWAGAEVVVYQLLRGLMRFPEIDLRAVILNEGKLASEVRRLGVPVTVIDEAGMSFARSCLTLRDIIRSEHIDVIHSHRYKENILACLSAWGMGVGLVSTQHGMPEAMNGTRGISAFLVSRLNTLMLTRNFDSVVAVSREMAAEMTGRLRYPAGRICAIRNGIEIGEWHPRKNDAQNIVIGSAGRLFPVKDYALMVKIAKTILSGTDDARFELAGEGPERAELERLIEADCIGEFFELRGELNDMDSFYRGIHIYLNTSLHEGIPMSILEAMASGLPVVAPAVGGISEIIEDGVCGYLVQGRDPDSFAGRCRQLIRDRELRETMGRAARERVARYFSCEKMASEYKNLYLTTARSKKVA